MFSQRGGSYRTWFASLPPQSSCQWFVWIQHSVWEVFFFVTPLVNQNLTLIKRRDGKHSYFFGPAFVHNTRLTEDYRYFISQLKIINPTLKLVQAVGTNDELALSNAVLSELPDVIRLKCKIHKRDNVIKKLQAMKIRAACEGEILKDIFCEVTGGTPFRGLHHSKNPDALDQKLADLHEKWENLAPGFFRWFQKEEADTFKPSTDRVSSQGSSKSKMTSP